MQMGCLVETVQRQVVAGALLRKSASRVHAAAPHCDAASRVRGLNAFQARRWKAEAHAVVALPTDEPSLIQDWQWSVHAFFPHLDKHERSEFVCLALHCFRGRLSSHRGIHFVEPLTQLLTKARAPVAHPCIPTCGAEAGERPRERLQRRRARLWGPFFIHALPRRLQLRESCTAALPDNVFLGDSRHGTPVKVGV